MQLAVWPSSEITQAAALLVVMVAPVSRMTTTEPVRSTVTSLVSPADA